MQRVDEGATGRIEFNEYGQRTFFTIRILEYNSPEFHDIAVWDPVKRLGEIIDPDEHYSKKIEEKLHNKTFTVVSRIGAPFLLNRYLLDHDGFPRINQVEVLAWHLCHIFLLSAQG